MPKKMTREEFIEKAKGVHGDKYDLSLVEYVNTTTKVKLICSEHGEFEITPKLILSQQQGCRACGYAKNAKDRSLGTEEFVKRSVEVHGDLYDYSKTEYVSQSEQVLITCKIHGDFYQLPQHHMRGSGCQKCYDDRRVDLKPLLTTEQWVTAAKMKHGDRFDYSRSVYTGNGNKIKIICRVHGEFEQIANDHTSKGSGCSRCSGVKKFTTEDFIAKARSIHGDLYSYDKVDYERSSDKVIITCKKHGDFNQIANDHLSCKAGCPSCAANGVSKPELEIIQFLRNKGLYVETRNRKLIKPYELDILIPDMNVAIEFNGVYYHSDNFPGARSRHKTKTDLCSTVGWKLIHIFEDDWRDRKEVVKKTLEHILNLSNEKVYARKCSVVYKPESEVREFYLNNHMQGSGYGTSLCLEYEGVIVAAMQFAKCYSERNNSDETRFELVRYASKGSVVGGASKLFKSFINNNPKIKTIVSYSNNDMFTGKMYEILGFEKVANVQPDYKVVDKGTRMHKSGYTKTKLKVKYPHVYSDDKTEKEICHELKLFRIYDSGKIKWEYRIKD